MKIALVMLAAACGVDHPGAATWSTDYRTTDGVVLGVWGSGPHDVWAVGGQADRPLVLHGDGATWTPVAAPGTSLLYSVYGFSATDVYAVGEAGTILHFDGTAWTRVASGTNETLFGLWGASGDDVWIVGGNILGADGSAIVLRGARTSFQAVDVPAGVAPSVLFKAHGYSAEDVMFVGGGGAIIRWDGAQWGRDAVPIDDPLRSTWGRSAGDVFAVGGSASGEILHFDGSAWSLMADLQTEGLSGVFASVNGPTIAVGPGLVLEISRDGAISEARVPELHPMPSYHGVWGDQDGTIYVVGGDLHAYPAPMSGVILRRE